MEQIIKDYIERSMLYAGLTLCAMALALVFFKICGVKVWSRFADLVRFSEGLLKKILSLMAVCILVFGAGLIWYWTQPFLMPPETIASVIIDTQMERARTITDADVIVIGDSSALMGINAVELSSLLGGRKVEKLSTVGWVGPRGYAHLLEMYFRRGQKATAVVFIMHAVTLAESYGIEYRDIYEDIVVNEKGFREKAKNPIVGLRSKINTMILGRLFALPIPGERGQLWGTHLEVGEIIMNNAGSIHEPVMVLPKDPEAVHVKNPAKDFKYEFSNRAQVRMVDFANIVAKFPVQRIFFGFAPTCAVQETAQLRVDYNQVLESSANILRKTLGAKLTLLSDIEPFQPDGYFVSAYHLNELGRRRFTRQVYDQLLPFMSPPQEDKK